MDILRTHTEHPLQKTLAASLALAAMTACGTERNFETNYNEDIIGVSLHDGANVREQPFAESQTNPDPEVFQVELNDHEVYNTASKTVETPTPEGAYLFTNNNGEWYGIPAKDMLEVVADPEIRKKIKEDNDAILWVNEARSTAEYAVTE